MANICQMAPPSNAHRGVWRTMPAVAAKSRSNKQPVLTRSNTTKPLPSLPSNPETRPAHPEQLDGVSPLSVLAALDFSGCTISSPTLTPTSSENSFQKYREISRKIEGQNQNWPLEDQSELTPPGWPVEPSVLKKSRIETLEIWGYVFMAALAAGIFAFASLAATVHNTYPGRNMKYSPDSSKLLQGSSAAAAIIGMNGTVTLTARLGNALNLHLLEAANFGPTILPIVFSTIVGTTLRLLARWKAEKGSRVETLELLVGSRSFSSTASTLFSIRTIGTLNICLLLLWSLSPLAGQASLRVLTTTNVTDASVNFPWYVANTTKLGIDTSQEYSGGLVTDSMNMLALTWNYCYAVTLDQNVTLEPSAVGPSDYWGYPVPPMSGSNSTLMSLTGIPIYGPSSEIYADSGQPLLPLVSSSNLTFPSSLFEFNCPSMSKHSTNESWANILGNRSVYSNTTTLGIQTQAGSGFFFDPDPDYDPKAGGLQNVLFGSFYTSMITIWNCSVRLNTREYSARCKDHPYDHNSASFFRCHFTDASTPSYSAITPLSNNTIAASIASLWPIVDPGTAGVSSFTEQFLFRGSAQLGGALVNLSTLDNVTLATRLTTTFNTLWTTLLASSYQPDFGFFTPEVPWRAGLMNTTSSTPILFSPFTIITCNWFYFTVLTLTSALLVACALLSAWLRYKIVTPDILGYVSSMTIENPYTPIPGVPLGSGSTLNGLERSKLLRNMRVRIGDVREAGKFGKITLAAEGGGVVKCKKGRKFV